MQDLPDLNQMGHAQKDELIGLLWQQCQTLLLTQSHMQAQLQHLQGRLNLNSSNSGKPPSSDGLAKPAPKSRRIKGQRKTGGQPGHPGATLRQSEQVDQTIIHPAPSHCSACQLVLTHSEVGESRQVLELPPLRVQVIAHQQMRAVCTCGQVHLGQWPLGVNAPVQYGASVKAMAVQLNQFQLLPLARSAALLNDLYGIRLSQASIQAFAQEAASILLPTVAAIGQAVRQAPIVHADESGIRMSSKLYWLHCAVTGALTWLGPHAKRGMLAIEALGILPGFKGTLVHDGLASYKQLECTHSLCNAHHIRELVYIHEQENEQIWDAWAQEMITLLCAGLKEVELAAAPLSAQRHAQYLAQWEALLQRGEALNPPLVRSGTLQDGVQGIGARGRAKQSKATNLLKRLRQYTADVWRFMTDQDVPFTNNLAEQALRMCKVRQKISGCFRTLHGADTFFTIRSYLATMHKQKANLFLCLVSTFKLQPIQPCFDV